VRITLCGSINFAKEILRIRDDLHRKGHEVFVPLSITDFSIASEAQAEQLKSDRRKYLDELKPYYTRNHFSLIEGSEAILVVNIMKNGIENYVGGATFAEIMVALYLGKKIFFLNPLPKDERLSFMIDELEAAKPIILNGNLDMVV
jgi:hypothetical protein